MTADQTRSALALAIVLGFFAVVFVVLFGFVNVGDPTIAKLVGLIFGYVTGLIQPVLLVYFGSSHGAPPSTE